MIAWVECAREALLSHKLRLFWRFEQVSHLKPVFVVEDVVERALEILRVICELGECLAPRQCLVTGNATNLKVVELVGRLDLT